MDLLDKVATLSNLKKKSRDDIEKMISVFSVVKDEDVQKLLKAYQELKRGEIHVVTVTSSLELDENQKKTIKEKINKKFPEKKYGFDFDVDPDTDKGISIMIDDNIINFQPEAN